MSIRLPPQRVPTLTEVIELGEVCIPGEPSQAVDLGYLADAAEPGDAAPLATLPSEAALTERVLADVQRQVEAMLEHRLREALMPALLSATDALILQVRSELPQVLQAMVARAVVQELARQRGR